MTNVIRHRESLGHFDTFLAAEGINVFEETADAPPGGAGRSVTWPRP